MINVFTDGGTCGFNGKLGTISEVGLGVRICILPEKHFAIKAKGISNNEAEFLALILAMRLCLHYGYKNVKFHLDSKIIVNRANGNKPKKAKHKNERMDNFQNIVLKLARDFDNISFIWIPREQNSIADELSKRAKNNSKIEEIVPKELMIQTPALFSDSLPFSR